MIAQKLSIVNTRNVDASREAVSMDDVIMIHDKQVHKAKRETKAGEKCEFHFTRQRTKKN